MKNHIQHGDRLLQTNKKWSALKQQQRDLIFDLVLDEHDAYVESNERIPMKANKDTVIDAVYATIEEHGIWIPYDEFHREVAVFIDRLNREHPLFVRPTKKAKPPKQQIPKVSIADFPQDTHGKIKDILAAELRQYILKHRHIPYKKIRNMQLNKLMSVFNSKHWVEYGKHLIKDDALFELYDKLGQDIFAEYKAEKKSNNASQQ